MYQNKHALLPYVITTLSLSILTACGGGNDNSAPTFSEGTLAISVAEDSTQAVSFNAADVDGDVLTYSVANAPANGTLQLDAQTGETHYTPNANYFGNDNFSVRVSDGSLDNILQVSVNVTAVNDAPTFNSDILLVSGGEVKTGSVIATDIDDDALTYAVITMPVNGELTLNASTGEINYQLEELVEVEDTVTISVSDGVETVQETFHITTNLASNADRAYYYYTSDLSHLKQAEVLNQDLNDDISQSIINSGLATGYAEAGLTQRVDELLSPEHIVSAAILANTKLDVANTYQKLAKYDDAEILRSQAKSIYNQYIANKGVNRFNTSDITFYLDLSDSYNEAGDSFSAIATFEILDLLFSSVLGEEYDPASIATFFGYQREIVKLTEKWEQSKDEDDRAYAILNLDKLYGFANRIGYQKVVNDRHGNLGQPFHSTRQVALAYIVELYTRLDDRSKAKSAAADLLALHGVVNYDPLYPREASEYSQTTKIEYPAGIGFNIKPLITLYPELDAATFIAGMTTTSANSWMTGYAAIEAEDARLMALVRVEPDGNKALALVEANRDESNLRNHFTNLINYNSSEPGLAIYRQRMGDYAGAVLALEAAESLLSSDAYISQNLDNQQFLTGNVGCQNLIKIHQQLAVDDNANQEAYTNSAKRVAKMCVALAKEYYADGVDGSDITIEDAIQANSQLIEYLHPLGLTAEIDQVLAITKKNLDKYDVTSLNEDARIQASINKIDQLKNIAGSAFSGGDYQRAQIYFDSAIELIISVEKTISEGYVSVITERFLDQRGSESNYPEFIKRLKEDAGVYLDYAEVYSDARSQLKTLIDANLKELKRAPSRSQVDFVPFFATQLAQAGFYTEALDLIDNENLGEVEKGSIKTMVAKTLARQDDFPGQNIATVDTDHDGKPNFFSAFATEEQILASGLVLDEDSDNDGVSDVEDSQPLVPNAQ